MIIEMNSSDMICNTWTKTKSQENYKNTNPRDAHESKWIAVTEKQTNKQKRDIFLSGNFNSTNLGPV